MYFGYLDIENDELQKYFDAAKEKAGVCRIPPRGRFAIVNDFPKFDGLVCSQYMEGEQTGVSAETCRNCIIKKVQE